MFKSQEYYLYRILSGKTPITYNNKEYVVSSPSFDVMCQAAMLYEKSLDEATLLGALSQEELIYRMVDHNLWSPSEEGDLEKLPKQIEDIKADIYQSHEKLQSVTSKRKVFEQLDKRLHELLKRKNRYSMLSAEGIADFHKTCFLICSSCGLDYYGDVNLNGLYYSYLENLVGNDKIREIAKMHDWQQYWSAIKLGANMLGPMLTNEQNALISWAKFYDNIYESAESPPQTVIDDDLLLDGWCIVRRRKRNQDDGKKAAENFGDGGEIFISAEDPSHAQRINDLNDAKAKMLRRQQQNQVQQRGQVLAQEMPDVKMELRQKATNMFRDKVKGK